MTKAVARRSKSRKKSEIRTITLKSVRRRSWTRHRHRRPIVDLPVVVVAEIGMCKDKINNLLMELLMHFVLRGTIT